MSFDIDIRKKTGDFTLDVRIKSLGKAAGILGASGCGKSMTLKCIAGVLTPDEGRIAVGGRVLFDSEMKINLPPRERKVGYLFQNCALFPTMTVEKNIAAGIRADREEKRRRTAELVRTFRLAGFEKHYPHQLSGGQQQRTALARIIACGPDVILLDEPFSAMDANLRARLCSELFEYLADFHGDLMIVSHNLDELWSFAGDLTVMDEGHAIESGPADELFRAPRRTQTARLLGCGNIFDAAKISEHAVRCPALAADLETDAAVPDSITHIGIFEGDIIPSENAGIHCAAVSLRACMETVKEHVFTLKTQGGGELRVKVPKAASKNAGTAGGNDPFPQFAAIPKESILLLTE